jgi:TldD protein
MLEKQIIDNALKIILDQGHQFAEIFCERKSTNSLSLENNSLEKIRNGLDSGTGLRIVNGAQVFYGYTNSLEETEIINLAKELALAAKTGKAAKRTSLQILKEAIPNKKQAYHYLPETVALSEKIVFLEEANKTARAFDKRISQVTVNYADTTQEVLIANSSGVLAQDLRVRTRFVTQVIAKDKKSIETGYEAPGFAKGIEMLSLITPQQVATKAARRAIQNLEADHAPAGPMTVVLAGAAGGTMVHEACGHALEADFIHKKTSIFTNKLNKPTVSSLITVIDDGTIDGGFGSLAFDDEGTPCKENILIKNGVVKGFMNDLLNAKLLGHKPSGNGRRESYRYSPIPRMTNTYIAAGKSKYQDIVSSVKEGLLVTKMGGGQVDITNGNFVFEVSEGYLLKNGKIDRPIKGATLVGNGIDVLSSVDMVGDDLHYIPGVCGKGQAAPVSDGQPTLRIPNLIVGGQG